MRKTLALLAVVFTIGVTGAFDAEARRLGGAKSSGMQRQNVTQPAPAAPQGANAPTQSVAPATAGAAAAAPAAAAAGAKRSWMGPVAGLAAGLGIAALASHFGFGEALANMLTIALVALAVMLVIGFVMRRFAQQRQPAMAPAYGSPAPGRTAFGQAQGAGMQRSGSLIGSALAGNAAQPQAAAFPPGFDAAAFERNARSQFMALQAANDAGDLVRLGDFLTPEMLQAAREEIAARGGATQETQVFGLAAQVLDVTTEADRYVASVRFTGSVRDQAAAEPEPLDEIWHLVKSRDGLGGWMLAGIQQAD